MSEPDNKSEPSMEEILASIRQIISEEGPDKPRAKEPGGEDDDVLELTQVVREDGSLSDLGRREASQAAGGLISESTTAAASSSIAALAGTLRREPAGRSVIGGGKPLDALVREALEPHLKAWLDQNLAELVDRVVREEIQKMIRRGEDGGDR